MKLRNLIFLTFFIGVPTFAAMEFPVLKTDKDIINLSKKIRKLIPETVTSDDYNIHQGVVDGSGDGIESYIINEKGLIELLQKDPKYMELAKARPALQTFIFQSYIQQEKKGYGVTREWTSVMDKVAFRSAAELSNSISVAARISSTNIFSGLSRFVPPELRKNLGEPVLQKRWRAIRPTLNKMKIADLRKDFDIHRFGVEVDLWTLQTLDDLILSIDEEELQIAGQIQLAWEDQYGKGRGTWFLDPVNNLKVLELLSIEPANRTLASFIEALGRRMNKVYTAENETTFEKVLNRELILRELPPYLALYRGCVGNDCSTSSSTFFPYSPLERDWLVQDKEGNNLGYVSGNITTVNEKPCLYIRDITGPKLIAEDIPLIITGFYLSRKYYGADQMTIEPLSFTNQNHFPELVEELTKFPSISEVNQIFEDAWIRTKYLDTVGGGRYAYYDSPEQHQGARLIELGARQTENYKIVPNGGQNAIKQDIWTSLSLAINSNDATLLDAKLLAKGTRKAPLIQFLRNENHLSVEDYEQGIVEVFAKAGIEFSKNLRKKHEALFSIGYLNAPDAFQGAAHRRQSIRYVIEILWRNPEPQTATPFIQANLELFENDEVMIRQVKTIFERKRAEDVQRLKILWDSGFRFQNLQLSTEDWIWAQEQLNEPKATLEIFSDLISVNHEPLVLRQKLGNLARLLANENDQDESIAIEASNLLMQADHPLTDDSALSEVKNSIRQEDNPLIRVPLSILYLREGIFEGNTALVAYRYLTRKLDKLDVSDDLKEKARELLTDLPAYAKKKLNDALTEYDAEKKLKKEEKNCEEALAQTRAKPKPRTRKAKNQAG